MCNFQINGDEGSLVRLGSCFLKVVMMCLVWVNDMIYIYIHISARKRYLIFECRFGSRNCKFVKRQVGVTRN